MKTNVSKRILLNVADRANFLNAIVSIPNVYEALSDGDILSSKVIPNSDEGIYTYYGSTSTFQMIRVQRNAYVPVVLVDKRGCSSTHFLINRVTNGYYPFIMKNSYRHESSKDQVEIVRKFLIGADAETYRYIYKGYPITAPDGLNYQVCRMRQTVGDTYKQEWADTAPIININEFIDKMNISEKQEEILFRAASNLASQLAPSSVGIRWRSGVFIIKSYSKAEAYASCMSKQSASKLAEFYAANPQTVKLAVMVNTEKVPIARALIWISKKDNSTCWYCDRIYPPTGSRIEDSFKKALEKEAKKHGVELKYLRGTKADEVAVPMKLGPNRLLPYIDTMRFGQLLEDGRVLVSSSTNYLNYPVGAEIEGTRIVSIPQVLNGYDDGGHLQRIVRTCACGRKYDSNPLVRFVDYKHDIPPYWEVKCCLQCARKEYVRVVGGTFNKRSKCEWSDHLKGWVDPHTRYTLDYLVKINGAWYDKLQTTSKDGNLVPWAEGKAPGPEEVTKRIEKMAHLWATNRVYGETWKQVMLKEMKGRWALPVEGSSLRTLIFAVLPTFDKKS